MFYFGFWNLAAPLIHPCCQLGRTEYGWWTELMWLYCHPSVRPSPTSKPSQTDEEDTQCTTTGPEKKKTMLQRQTIQVILSILSAFLCFLLFGWLFRRPYSALSPTPQTLPVQPSRRHGPSSDNVLPFEGSSKETLPNIVIICLPSAPLERLRISSSPFVDWFVFSFRPNLPPLVRVSSCSHPKPNQVSCYLSRR